MTFLAAINWEIISTYYVWIWMYLYPQSKKKKKEAFHSIWKQMSNYNE